MAQVEDPVEYQDSSTMFESRKRFNAEKVKEILESLNVFLREAQVYKLTKDMGKALKARSQMAGFLVLELLLTQGLAQEATRASWVEILVEVRSLMRSEEASLTVSYDDGSTAAHIVASYGYDEVWTFDALADFE